MATQWTGNPPEVDDFGDKIVNEFYDAKTCMGPWAIMTPKSWKRYGFTQLGPGLGQHYRKIHEAWLKVEG